MKQEPQLANSPLVLKQEPDSNASSFVTPILSRFGDSTGLSVTNFIEQKSIFESLCHPTKKSRSPGKQSKRK
jgi:hypothetical protein